MPLSERPDSSLWIVPLKKVDEPQLRLLYFPHAGGNAWSYHRWSEHLPKWVEPVCVELPGRGRRIGQPPFEDGERLLDAFLPVLSRELTLLPTVLFGHSMGALIAFSCCSRLEARGEVLPRALIVSGQKPPHLPSRRLPIRDLPPQMFLEHLSHLHGTPKEVFESPELVELLLPTLRADVTLVETWLHRPSPPLSIPLYAFGGKEDCDVLPEELAAWGEHAGGPFQKQFFQGGHFFHHSAECTVLRTIIAILTAHAPACVGSNPTSPELRPQLP